LKLESLTILLSAVGRAKSGAKSPTETIDRLLCKEEEKEDKENERIRRRRRRRRRKIIL
jgi:translation initiation factor 1 (eIF-1/SUI1)